MMLSFQSGRPGPVFSDKSGEICFEMLAAMRHPDHFQPQGCEEELCRPGDPLRREARQQDQRGAAQPVGQEGDLCRFAESGEGRPSQIHLAEHARSATSSQCRPSAIASAIASARSAPWIGLILFAPDPNSHTRPDRAMARKSPMSEKYPEGAITVPAMGEACRASTKPALAATSGTCRMASAFSTWT